MEKKQKAAVLTFETALQELEQIANELESGNLGLDEAIAAFEKGMKYAKSCHEKLEEAERKIEILQKGGDGHITKKRIEVKKETGEIEEGEEMQGSLL